MKQVYTLYTAILVCLLSFGNINIAEAQTALQFDGSNDYVTFGTATGTIGVTTFTLEAWVNRAAGGATMSTGSLGFDGAGGRPNGAYPVLTKGMGQGETPANINMNFFLGITVTGVIGADFEDNAGGVNHPAWGVTVVPIGSWHHIAATYNGQTWNLYLDGVLDATSTLSSAFTPESTSIQHAALAAGLNSTGGLATGFFAGSIDEPRVWNVARTQAQIQASMNSEITSGTGLSGRWGLNEGSGTSALNSIAGSPAGSLTNGPAWIAGAPALDPPVTPPSAPSGLTATAASAYSINIGWADNSNTETSFEVWRSTDGGSNFSLLASTSANATSYQDIVVNSAAQYFYRVRAANSGFTSSYTNDANATTLSEGSSALNFGSNNAYVTFGQASSLGAQSFTLECWFIRTGTGAFTTTGTGGVLAIPLISKGMAEADNSNADMNYFLGINSTTRVATRSYGPPNVLVADFEEGASPSTNPGLNHPVAGVTPIVNDTWYHAAVTYDSNNRQWRLYLNGILEKDTTLAAGTRVPQFNSTQHAALGTALQSNGLPGTSTYGPGYLNGTMDEVRIWNYARSSEEIIASINSEIVSSQTGLIGRWGLNENAGSVVNGNSGTFVDGTVTGSGYSWVSGAPFNISFTPPADPSALYVTPVSGSILQLTWTDNSNNETGFQIERSTTGSGGTFSLLTTVGANTTTFTDQNLSELSEYCYRVRSTNAIGSSAFAGPVCATTPVAAYALQLTPTSHVTFGAASSLATQNFTIEAWFRRTGTGTPNTTETGGIDIVPILSKGSPQAEGSTVDENYILGINSSGNVIAADFEEGTGSSSPGLNHPLSGTTTIQNDVWYHAAATFSLGVFSIYLNGVLENSLNLGAGVWPQGASIQHSALGTMIESGGTTHGYFAGVIDEARIWNYARTDEEIRATINSQVTNFQTGLLARWGLNEGTGTVVNGSAGTTVNGTITNAGYSWVTPGAPFNVVFNVPAAPSNLSATPLDGTSVRLDWTDNSTNETGFEIERSTNGSSGPYSPLTTLGTNITTYTDENLSAGTQYCYRVRCVNQGVYSGYTTNLCVSTLTTGTVSVTFQEGVNGYAGTKDTHIYQVNPNTSLGGLDYFKWDTESTGGEMFGLLRFDDIFGSSAGQIPVNAIIQSATLSYTVVNIGDIANVYEAAVAWTEDATYNDFGGDPGVQTDEYGVLVTTATGAALNTYTIDVKSSLDSWVANPTNNRGWLFYPTAADGVNVNSSEFATSSSRPRLTVVYILNPPNQPVLVLPADNATGATTSPALRVTVSDPELRNLTVNYYGRKVATIPPGEDFTVVILPDAQNYTAGLNNATLDMFTDQTNWCVTERTDLNIAYVVMEGDITNDNTVAQWANAVTAMSILESPSPGIPYGISVGNHDGAPSTSSTSNTALYNTNFGVSRFSGRPYYGGHYGSDNDNNFVFFSAGGLDFIVIHLGLGTYAPPSSAVLSWANTLLQTYNTRRAIVVNHGLLTGTEWFGPGQAIYDALKGNSNLFLMLCGHLNTEFMRTDTYNNNTVYTVLTDYQGETNGGNGWLRMLTFSPANNRITLSSYSPHLAQANYSAPTVLDYNMTTANPYQLIGTTLGVSSGTTLNITWPDLDGNSEYEWYVTVSNGENTVTGPVWSFTTMPLKKWTGNTDNNWNTVTNWLTGSEPGPGDEVIIEDKTNDPVISSSGWGYTGNLIIKSGGSLTVMPGAPLSVAGDLTNAGQLIIESTLDYSGSLMVTGTATGNVTFNRQLRTDAVTGDRHYFSSPVGGLTGGAFTAANPGKIKLVGSDYQIRSWNESNATWPLVTSGGSLVPGVGYSLNQVEGADGKLSFTGTIVKQCTIPATSPYKSGYIDRSTPAAYGVGNETADIWADGRNWVDYGGGGWNLLGNPFLSAMSAVSFIYNAGNLGNFDPNYQALYVYNGEAGIYQFAGIQNPGPAYPMGGFHREYVAAGQGFFVLAINAGASFTFSSDMQPSSSTPNGTPMLKSSVEDKTWPGLQLKVKFGEKESSTLIVYNGEMTSGLDPGFDIGQLSAGPDVEIYTSLVEKDNSVNFAQQALPMTDFNKNIVPVGIDSEKGGEVTFSAFTVPLPNNKFWLEDRKTGIFTDLNLKSYTVTLPGKTYGTGRFFIYASVNTPTGIDRLQSDDTGVRVWTANDKVIIKGEVSDNAICEVYDLRGQKILEAQLNASELNTVTLPTGSHGVYLVRLIDGVKITARKVVIL